MDKNLEVYINDKLADVGDIDLQLTYKLEDADNFQTKTSDNAFDVVLPYTLTNNQIANNYQNPSIEDNTPGQTYRNPNSLNIFVNGQSIFAGKAFLQNAKKEGYEYSFYGGNASWIIDLKSTTLHDFLKHINFLFTKANMVASWNYNGNDSTKPYVFAPVKYRSKMDFINEVNSNVDVTYLRPAISPYWIIYNAFKSIGYKIQSEFLSTNFFRRLTMPWTWGNFLESDGTKLEVHKFLAKTLDGPIHFGSSTTQNVQNNLNVVNDYKDGAYDNNDDYSQLTTPVVDGLYERLQWKYKAPHFGILDAMFSVQIQYDIILVGNNSNVILDILWAHISIGSPNPNTTGGQSVLMEWGVNLSQRRFIDIRTIFIPIKDLYPLDEVQITVNFKIQEGTGIGARAVADIQVLAFTLEYFTIPIGGNIDFDNYLGFKKYKFLDMLGGIADTFDISFATDTKNKIVYIEPTHPVLNLSSGYFNGKKLDWTDKKVDSSDVLNLFSDYERNLEFKFKPDSADGILKTLQDRHSTTIGLAKYLLPERFKSETKEVINRFFSPVTHFDNIEMKDISGIAPQMICLVPENVSNTSNREANNTFQPKLTWYRGNGVGFGAWKYDGEELLNYPFMFAVNYKDGGELDPVLSYCDERNANNTIMKGLLKKFFWQRLAIMRNGQYYKPGNFKLNLNDIMNIGHREFKLVNDILYELIEISGFSPIEDDAETQCSLKKWVPITLVDKNNTYPSDNAYIIPVVPLSNEDVKYITSLALTSDVL